MQKVFIVDKNHRAVNPVLPKEARNLLTKKKASVFRTVPFVLILKDECNDPVDPLRVKIDPGSKTTGLAVINDVTGEVIWAGELTHRGMTIKNDLTSRRQIRRGRRGRKTRYRMPRFNNRVRGENWLAPSLMSRVYNIETWVKRLIKFCPVSDISMELVRFDTQKMLNPEINGVEYQQGELFGYEVREYLLEKYNRKCVYCGATDTRLEVEHIVPKSKGGSNKVSNLTIACRSCNEKKGNKDIKDFLKGKKSLLDSIVKKAKQPLADTAAVNSTRFKLLSQLKLSGLPVETGSGGLTKFNRISQGLEKTHWLDACCVGTSTPKLIVGKITPLKIKAMGHGNRFLGTIRNGGFTKDHNGVPFGCKKTTAKSHLFKLSNPDGSTSLSEVQTGDIAKVIVPNPIKDKKDVVKVESGSYISRVSIGSIPSLTKEGKGKNGTLRLSSSQPGILDEKAKVSPKTNFFNVVQKRDGYQYDV